MKRILIALLLIMSLAGTVWSAEEQKTETPTAQASAAVSPAAPAED